MRLAPEGHIILLQVTAQTLEQPNSSGASTAEQETGTASEVTPQQSPKHGHTGADPSRVTTPPQTHDRHASVDASSPVSVASADLESSQDIVTGQFSHTCLFMSFIRTIWLVSLRATLPTSASGC